MKNTRLFIATLLVAAAVSVAVVSCKKETPNALHNNTSPSVKTYAAAQVNDMNAYLKDFKKKMQTATRDGNETLSLEEAAWHLSSVANYDFANANVEFDDIRFDTLYSTVNVTGGIILLNDLATAYENISTDIDEFYHSLFLNEKHFHFINASISEEGTVTVSLMTTFKHSSRYLEDTVWSYNNLTDLWIDCYKFTDHYTSLPASTTGRTVLERALNWKESHSLTEGVSNQRVYYTATSDKTLRYRDDIDPFGSPNYLNSRLFANNTYLNKDIITIFCYLFDSALGLGQTYCPDGECIVGWNVFYYREEPFLEYHERFWKEHYEIVVHYGIRHEVEPGTGGSNY